MGARTLVGPTEGVYGGPETYFIDAKGTIVAKHMGPLDSETLQAYLDQLRGSRS